MVKAIYVAAFLFVASWFGVAHAQYVLVLKNGRQITVQSYREDGAMIKFSGLGGEIAISKDQVQTIRRAGEADRAAPSLTMNPPPAVISSEPPPPPSAPSSVKAPSAPPPIAPEQQRARKRAEEEKAYEDKVRDLTAQLKDLRDRYSLITRGNKGPEPSFFTTEEAFKGQQADLISRLRDAQYKAQGLPTGSASQSPPFSLDAPPAYTEREKELSDLRSRIAQVENDRQKMIDEMKAKGFETGSLFLD
jgi:hypothetical protein